MKRRGEHRPWRAGARRLNGVMTAKGLTRKQMITELRFGAPRCDAWLAGRRQPRVTAGRKLAKWLELPLSYLYCHPTPSLDGLRSFAEVAARASLEIFLADHRNQIPRDEDQLYQELAKSSAAPRTSRDWESFTREIIWPVRQFEIERGRSMERIALEPLPQPGRDLSARPAWRQSRRRRSDFRE